ncbi:MAG TPA: glutathione peroxidase [Pseudomonadota bacterium]|nr:glutathione peroxidase [Pseudomonadota bacterium]
MTAAKPAASPLYDLTVKTLSGEPQPLAQYRGKVLLIVNTASECGYTPQYAGLEALHQRYKDRDVVVIGVPSNDFGAQEPGGAAAIAKFCQVRYGVTFPLWEKTKTIGADAAPLYKLLAKGHGAPKWNFHKYLIGRDGQVRAAFPSSIEPDSKELISAIDAALAQPPPA